MAHGVYTSMYIANCQRAALMFIDPQNVGLHVLIVCRIHCAKVARRPTSYECQLVLQACDTWNNEHSIEEAHLCLGSHSPDKSTTNTQRMSEDLKRVENVRHSTSVDLELTYT